MSKRTQIIATFQVRLQVPKGSNIAELAEHVRVAIAEYIPGTASGPTPVKLVKKETTYV